MRRAGVVALLLAFGTSCSAPITPAASSPNAVLGARPAVVERVVDGDTLIVDLDRTRTRVRLIGVDTPETVKAGAPVECFGPQASAFAKRALPAGTHVVLLFDRDRLDRFDRTLAYLYLGDGTLFNLDLVRRGYARPLRVEPDVAHAAEFDAAARDAQRTHSGLWGLCTS